MNCPCCGDHFDFGTDAMGRKVSRRIYCTKCSDPKNDRQVTGCPECGDLFSYVPGRPRCDDCWSKRHGREDHPIEFDGLIPKTCACGCGEEINHGQRTVHRLRKTGLKLSEIAALMDQPYGRVKMWTRQISRSKKGHRPGLLGQRKTAQLPCARCGVPLKAFPTQAIVTCREICLPLDQFFARNHEIWHERYDAIGERALIIAAQLRAEIPLSLREHQLIRSSGKRSLDKMHERGIDAPYFDREDDRWPYYAAQRVVRGRHRKPVFVDSEAS